MNLEPGSIVKVKDERGVFTGIVKHIRLTLEIQSHDPPKENRAWPPGTTVDVDAQRVVDE